MKWICCDSWKNQYNKVIIRFSKHALIKIAHRKIGEKYVEATVEHPDYAEISGVKINMQITYDRDIDALSITLRRGRVEETTEIVPGVFLDVDKKSARSI